jgi:hypothetical protein
MEHNSEETKFILISVSHDVEDLILVVVDDLFDGLDLVLLV